ncbi:aldo/keto reductase [Microbacterium sp. p3-SID336]|uniref:aldo/keto reductase n=1 Tax=Microbacterium sp. p3-SID336 TaxID=2916212 RepID=UPI0021A3F2E4|nr:aldo/keto reductase [Microbacterium sp. p3-SID336]MCT1476785.1 aldo/keto reductase [Microbacterium sp. p3-SID336]
MMPQRPVGDLRVSSLGMGAMTLTQTPESDVARGVRAVHTAVDAGITLFDTADSYGPTSEMGVNERALAAALRSHPDAWERVIVATKGGHTRGPAATWWVDGSPAHLAAAARASAQRLGLDALPLYQHHRPDVRVPFAESLGALRQLVDDGVVVRVGVSNVDVAQLDVAAAILGDALVSVQNEYSLLERSSTPVLRRCEELGLAFLAWGPLGGMRAAKGLGGAAAPAAAVAERYGVSPQRVVLAWMLARSPVLIPIPGASRPESVHDSVAAVELVLDEADLLLLDRAGQAAR